MPRSLLDTLTPPPAWPGYPSVWSKDRAYRYTLYRRTPHSMFRGYVAFVGCNPSTADDDKDDPTLRSELALATAWGFGGVCLLNACAYVATAPTALAGVADPVGPENLHWLRGCSVAAGRVVVACGAIAGAYGRAAITALQGWGVPLWCLGRNKDGSPKHPLYTSKATQLSPFE